jgi:hypothetical protein
MAKEARTSLARAIFDSRAARHICGAIVAETYAKVMETLMANDFDPAG